MIELDQGNLNRVRLIEGRNRRLLVLRTPQPKAKVASTMTQVIDENLAEGFFGNPNNQIGIRSLSEQVIFAQRLQQIGVPTPATTLNQAGEQLITYIPDSNRLFDLWLRQDPRAPYATARIFEIVMRAHELDLVPGDRTGKNELVTPEAETHLIDFDLKLAGPEAREFEFANLMYRLSRAAHRGNPKQLSTLGEICKDALSGQQVRVLYDLDTLLRYAHRFVELSSEKGNAKLNGMTPIIQPEYSAELFSFLIDVIKYSIHRSE
jgi:hypothetical protein